MKRLILGFLILIGLAGGAFFVLSPKSVVEISPVKKLASDEIILNSETEERFFDIEPQKPLENPPKIIRAVYLTSWSAGNPEKINYLIDLAKKTEINAVVIDIKDYSGHIAYDIKLEETENYNAEEMRISRINSLIKRLHDENIYVIARITVFQDPILARARPDLAIHSKQSGGLWLDNKKLSWIDPAAKEAWDYNIAIAKEAAGRGFDELNFDYIRFASDGKLEDMDFPFWDAETPKQEVIGNFFKYLRSELKTVKISADLFGLATINKNDLGIGQIIEDAYRYFDYVSPMVYPSHYATGFLNYKNPAQYPYEVVRYSMESALKRLRDFESRIMNNGTTTVSATPIQNSKLRPWLQDFNLGATYDKEMVKKQIQAVYDAAGSTPELINGFMLWDPANTYTKEALEVE